MSAKYVLAPESVLCVYLDSFGLQGQHLLIFIMFLCLFLIALLMGMAGPKILVEHTEKGTRLLDKSGNGTKSISSGPFIILTPKLSVYRR